MLTNEIFILASSSPRRSELLKTAGLDFEVAVPDVDEIPKPGELPGDFVARMSMEKALDVCSKTREGRLVAGFDTEVVADGEIFGKPRDERDALRMLSRLSGRTHEVVTGFCVCRAPGEVLRRGVSRTEVAMKFLDTQWMRRYIKTGEPMDKAGAYAVQGAGSCFVERINGSWTGVVGLPLFELVSVLSDLGVVETSGADEAEREHRESL